MIIIDYGRIVKAEKIKTYAGKSNITNKTLYRTAYELACYKEGENILGYFGQDNPYTFNRIFKRKSKMDAFIKENHLIK